MAHSLARLLKLLAFPIAGALILGVAGSAYAQSAGTAAVAQGSANSTAGAQKRQTDASVATGRTAVSRYATPSASAAPIALALENTGPAPASTPEPLTLALVGGALAGLYGMRRHLN